jgi:hypothetical protein
MRVAGGQRRGRATVVTCAVALGASCVATPGQSAAVPHVTRNPTPGTDLFASTLPPATGGTKRICATSGLGIAVHCVDNVPRMPTPKRTASGVTFGHWIYCKVVCQGGLLRHELVHVRQFETYGDAFGPMYLAEAAQHGTGCENKWERQAYQEANGTCF